MDEEPRIRTSHSKRKGCCCGGHSMGDWKKSRRMNGTARRLERKLYRRTLR